MQCRVGKKLLVGLADLDFWHHPQALQVEIALVWFGKEVNEFGQVALRAGADDERKEEVVGVLVQQGEAFLPALVDVVDANTQEGSGNIALGTVVGGLETDDDEGFGRVETKVSGDIGKDFGGRVRVCL